MVDKSQSHARVIEILRASRVFGTLNETVLNDLAGFLKLQHVRGGSLVLRQGDISNSMFFLMSGRLRVSRRNLDGSSKLYNEIRPGESVGEAGMILQQPRAADVTAVRDSTLAVLQLADFETLLTLQPLAMNRVFLQAIYNHLRDTPQVVEQRYAQSFVVVPLHAGADTSEVVNNLVKAFSKMGRVHHLTPTTDGATTAETAQSGQEEIDRHDELEELFNFLVYEAEATDSYWTRRAFRQADQVIFVGAANTSERTGELEQQLAEEPGFAMKRKHLVLLYPATTSEPSDMGRWLNGREVERIYPIRSQHQGDYARLARFLTGTAVGVVLGGGGARGFAHLGVLRALEESNYPVDLVGGNSMGALIGAQYACGVPLDEIRERTKRFALGGNNSITQFASLASRLTIPVISLASGIKVERDLRKMFGDISVDSLWCPFFAAACNLSKACTTVLDSGPLWRAVLASNSPAGLLPPVPYKGDLLVDGAILENVPVDAMRLRLGTDLERRRGNGLIIAVDVDVRETLGVHPDLTRLSGWSNIKGHFAPAANPAPGITDIMYRATHIGGLNQRGRNIPKADHYLEPPVAGFPLMGYGSAAEIAEIGYHYAMEEISKWDR